MEAVNKVKPKYSEVLREFRDKTKWPQVKIAKAIGVRQKTISDWENGKSSARNFLAGVRFAILAQKNGINVDDLILSLPDPDPEPIAPMKVSEKKQPYQTQNS